MAVFSLIDAVPLIVVAALIRIPPPFVPPKLLSTLPPVMSSVP